jgi:hypothetical protein
VLKLFALLRNSAPVAVVIAMEIAMPKIFAQRATPA